MVVGFGYGCFFSGLAAFGVWCAIVWVCVWIGAISGFECLGVSGW